MTIVLIDEDFYFFFFEPALEKNAQPALISANTGIKIIYQ